MYVWGYIFCNFATQLSAARRTSPAESKAIKFLHELVKKKNITERRGPGYNYPCRLQNLAIK